MEHIFSLVLWIRETENAYIHKVIDKLTVTPGVFKALPACRITPILGRLMGGPGTQVNKCYGTALLYKLHSHYIISNDPIKAMPNCNILSALIIKGHLLDPL